MRVVVPYDKNVELLDISVDARGVDEDKEYIYNRFYRENIRRGNTIVLIYDYKNKLE